jgi:hypothetical protein
MKCILIPALTALLLSCPVAYADEPASTQPAEAPQTQPAKEVYREEPSVVTISRHTFTIPAPEGFMRSTKAQKSVEDLLDALTAPRAKRVISFISPEPIQYVDNMAQLWPYHSVQVSKDLIAHNMTAREFEQAMRHMKAELQKTVDKLKETNPGMMDRINEFRSQKTGHKSRADFPAMVTLPPFADEPRLQARTMIVTHTVNDEEEGTYSYQTVSVMSMVHINGQMLLLGTFASIEEMDWAQDINLKWARAILAANPNAEAPVSSSN